MLQKSVLAVAIATLSLSAFGANPANDNASNPIYNDGWDNSDNGGTGFGAWVLSTGVSNSSFFIGSSAQNAGGSSGNIDVGGKSFGIFANNAQTAADAIRPLTGGSLSVGQTITLSIDSGFIQTGGAQGFGLQTSAGANRLEFFFSGGSNSFSLTDNSGTNASGVQFTGNGLAISFTLTGADTYSMTVTPNGGSATPFSGTLAGTAGSGIGQMRFFNFNGGTNSDSNFYVNNLAVVPEPSTISLLAGPAILGAFMFVRRRRA